MKTSPLSVTFFYHSCVAVETNSVYLLFDYFPEKPHSKIPFPDNKKIYLFASHGHGDHFHPDIFKEGFAPSPISYVLSDDIKTQAQGKAISWVKPDQSYQIDDLIVNTLGSTDAGVSFLITVNGFKIFHCGDLNWWHWERFTKEEQERERIDYQREISKLYNHSIDLAFVPVDPRLGNASHLAANYFIDKIRPRYLVPIHLRTDFEMMKSFTKSVDPTYSHVLTFDSVGETKVLR